MASFQNPTQIIQTKTKYLSLLHHHYEIQTKLPLTTHSEKPHFDLYQNHSNSKFTCVAKMQRRFMNGIALMTAVSVFASVTPCYSSTPEDGFVKNTVSSYKIVIFSKSYCPYCRRAKDVFKELRQVPHVVELDERDDGKSIQDAISQIVGRRTVPQVFIGGKHIGGSDETVEAYQNGELAKLLGIESSGRADDL